MKLVINNYPYFFQENDNSRNYFPIFEKNIRDSHVNKFVDVLPLSILPAGVWAADLEVFPLAHTEK